MPELRVLHFEQSKGFRDREAVAAELKRINTISVVHTPLFREPLQRGEAVA